MIKPLCPPQVVIERSVAGGAVAKRAQALDTDPASTQPSLRVAQQKGRFVKRCPCTPAYLGCGYVVLHVAEGCDLGCSYCVLRGYFARDEITLFANTSALLDEVDGLLEHNRRPLRIGTGEFTDSLRYDRLLEINKPLVERFARQDRAWLELKTKTADIAPLSGLRHEGRTVLAWSLSPADFADEHEPYAASLDERLEAASTVAAWGYPVAFHFDPLCHFPGWNQAYTELVAALAAAVPAHRIAWISLGSLRYPKGFEEAIVDAPSRRFFLGETVRGLDGKVRYFKAVRLRLYRHLARLLRKWAGDDLGLYLCMESPQVWEQALGWRPASTRAVAKRIAEATSRIR